MKKLEFMGEGVSWQGKEGVDDSPKGLRRCVKHYLTSPHPGGLCLLWAVCLKMFYF